MSTGTLVTIQPDGTVKRERIEKKKGAELQDLQKAVGGYIERVRVKFEGRTRDAYVNEDGFGHRLAFNRTATALLAPPYKGSTSLVGPLAIWIPDPKKPRAATPEAA
jgi:hypothetical protein